MKQIFYLLIGLFFMQGCDRLVISDNRADIFIGANPADIRVKEKTPFKIPIFIQSKAFTGRHTELFIYREDIETGTIKYLSNWNGWVDAAGKETIKPILTYRLMPRYINYHKITFNNTSGIKPFIIYCCFDDNVDGKISDKSICSSHKVLIMKSQCDGLIISPPTMSYDMKIQKGKTEGLKITVKDICGDPIEFNAQSSVKWITLNKQRGILTLMIDTKTLPKGIHNGKIVVSTVDGLSKLEIDINLEVMIPVFFP